MKQAWGWAGLIFVASWAAGPARAAEWFVATNGNDAAAGTNWETAKQTIQAAIDAAASNDSVWVSSGVYATGGRVVAGSLLTNRVAIDKPIVVRSVNGPNLTTIRGFEIRGNSAVRCAYVGTNAVLSGFTLTNGATRWVGDINGGGAWCEASGVLTNCVLTGNSANTAGGGVFGGVLNDCILTGNSAYDGGGSAESTLNHCTLTGNSAPNFGGGSHGGTLNHCLLSNNVSSGGGGIFNSTLNDCLLTANHADWSGGGSYEGTLNGCTLSGNTTGSGGGSFRSTLNGCALTGNSATNGGGSYEGTLNSCTVSGNSAWRYGGGSYGGMLVNCTLTGNSAVDSGGGSHGSTNNNCIVYYNTAPTGPNYSGGVFHYSCTTPAPGGAGNLTNDPGLAGVSHLSVGSPCIGGGNNAYASGIDIDGEAWLDPPSMGCDEVMEGSITGVLGVGVWVAFTNSAVGLPLLFRADIVGRATASTWQWGDGSISSNQLYATHAFQTTDTYSVILTAFNEEHPSGVAATVTVQVAAQTVHYVDISNATPVAPYASWTTAARNIQDAVDAASQVGALVWVSNGVYATGGRAVDGVTTNRVVIDKAITVQSVNGPEWTLITGAKDSVTMRCAFVGTNAVLSGFTLTNGSAGMGGGARCAAGGILTNCLLTGNAAFQYGGGSYGGTLNHCLLIGNSAGADGGGSALSTLNDCTLLNNMANNGGGSSGGVLNLCTLSGNAANSGGGGSAGSILNHCLLTNNSAGYAGGGASSSTLNDCALSGNSAGSYGGGVSGSTLDDCVVSGNSARSGGGSDRGTLNNCSLASNSGRIFGGGSYDSTLNGCNISGNSATNGGGSYRGTLNGCAVSGNSAVISGGGAYNGTLNNCTLIGNRALVSGGGSFGATNNNCIVYYNSAPLGSNYSGGKINYSCTTPAPGGTGNITNEPDLVSVSHLSLASPCIGAGDRAYVPGTDIDGEAWLDPPSMGCDEVVTGSITGDLSVSAWASDTPVVVGFPVQFRADVLGQTTASAWHWGDGSSSSNQVHAEHSFPSEGIYDVTLTAFNESHPLGVAATVTVQVVSQLVYYVDIGNAMPAPPFSSWATAATNIQDAIDVAASGALVMVSNGVYATGGRAVYGAMTNRVVIDKPVLVQSVNGPDVTIIQGAKEPIFNGNGNGAVRCAYVGSNAVLAGFTLTKGATMNSGNENREQSGGGVWCEAFGEVSHCTLAGNTACRRGGGSYGGTLNDCAIWSNSTCYGGGACDSTLSRCVLTANAASQNGGGSHGGTLNHCILTRNFANWYGGGSYGGTLYNSLLTNNSVRLDGGGAYGGALNNCFLTGNAANRYGGGSYNGTLNNCTATRNSAGSGGGAHGGALNNCIVYYNTAATNGPNYSGGSANYTCTTPAPGGTGNVTNEPIFASDTHLALGSPCIGAGSSAHASGTDIDGEAWQNPPSMGCDEVAVGSVTGALSVSVWANHTNVAVDFPVQFQADISGRVAGSVWQWMDGAASSNQPHVTHSFSTGGVYEVTLIAYNESYPLGVAATVTVQATTQTTYYVDIHNGTPASPFSSWATAATNIQDAIDAAPRGEGVRVWVDNGVYAAGGRTTGESATTNRVVIDKPVTVSSVNGPEATIIQGTWDPTTANGIGDAAVRCVYVGTNAQLSGFTLTNGATRTADGGGGAWCGDSGVLSNCVLTGNSAGSGGGSRFGILNGCTLAGNSAGFGGGSSDGILNGCTLSGNLATHGGGSSGGTLNGCTLSGNSADISAGGSFQSTLNNCLLSGNAANALGGGSVHGTLTHCALIGNSTGGDGGGSWYGTLNHCTLSSNRANNGGGNFHGTLSNCVLTGNSAGLWGGGAKESYLIGCTLAGNSAHWTGGGSASCTLNNCILSGNRADNGGGSHSGTLSNCLVTGNSAGLEGGGSYCDMLYNCTVVGNSSSNMCGGESYSVSYNSIVYFNSAPSGPNYMNTDYSWAEFFACCTTPAPGGAGNITNDPQFVDAAAGNYRLKTNSPCIDRGSNSYVQGTTDLGGNPRIALVRVDMGAYEVQSLGGYVDWAAAITNGLTNDTDCAAGDGVPNLLKYATGSSPMAPDNLSELGLASDGGPTLRFNRNPNATDVTLVIQGADEMSDGATWRGLATNRNGSWGGVPNVSESGQGNPVACAVQDPVPLFTNRFLRLKVTRP